MARPRSGKDLSLKSLELFQACAEKGSLQAVATETGLTISTVSHHLRNLEDNLGVELLDHGRRPMVLTPTGRRFLRNIETALFTIRKAKAEVTSGEITAASYLRLGSIEDFDSDIVPELAIFLSAALPSCDFLFDTHASHSIIELLQNRELDIGITSLPQERLGNLRVRPLLHDPFVVVLPKLTGDTLNEVVSGKTKMPFLRFSSTLMMARQIEAQLKRLGVNADQRFECSNNQTLMAMVAAGAGWTITTPLLFASARRFQSKLQMHRFPSKSFARTLAVVSTPDCSQRLVSLIDKELRGLIATHSLKPMLAAAPWLADEFTLVD